jgi:hypothetical protein
MLVQYAHFVPEFLNVGATMVPDIGVLGHDAKGQLLATATDDERWIWFLDRFRFEASLRKLVVLPLKVGEMLREEPLGDFTRFSEAADALAWRVERDTHALVLVLVPAGADAEVDSTVGDHIHRGRHVGMDRGVAVGVACDH